MDEDIKAEGEKPEETQAEGATPPADSKEEIEQLRKALKAANSESAQRRKRLDEYERAESARKEAEMTETQKLEKRAADAEAKNTQLSAELKTTRIKSEIKLLAIELGFADVEDAYNLIDKSGIEADDNGVKGVKEALETLAKAKPYLIKQSKGDGVGTARGAAKKPQPDAKPNYTLPRL